MNHFLRASVGPCALVVVNITTVVVLTLNQREGLYSPSADSLPIPIGVTLLASMAALFLFAVVAVLRRVVFAKGLGTYVHWGAVLAMALGYVSLALIGVAGLAYWLVPDHYTVAFSYVLLLAWLTWEVRQDVRMVRGAGGAV